MTSAAITPTAGAEAGLSERLTFLVEQLWQFPLAEPGTRAVVGPASRSGVGWVDAESYRILPSPDRATMLVPDGPRAATVGSLLNYRGLRRRRTQAQRTALGAMARWGRLPFPVLRLQVAAGSASAPVLPLRHVADALGLPEVFASIGINTSSNRKTTLQLVTADGAPAGFAKFAWDPASDRALEVETEALAAVGGRRTLVRAPALLARGSFYGHPFLVAEPVPLDSVGVRAGVPPPTAVEIFTLCPLVRRAPVAGTGQFVALRDRLRATTQDSANTDAVRSALALLELVGARQVPTPVVARCHGDLTAWNSARSRDGTLWCWDWESSEVDTVAGLDAIHWHMADGGEQGRTWDGHLLRESVRRAEPLAVAAGMPRETRGDVAAVYAATITERACALAAGAGGWEAGWVLPAQLVDLLAAARELVTPLG